MNTGKQSENFNVYIGNSVDAMGLITIPYLTKAIVYGLKGKSETVLSQLDEERKNLQKLKVNIIRLTNALHSDQFGQAIPILLNDSFVWVGKSLKGFKVDNTLTFKIEWLKDGVVAKHVTLTWGDVLKMDALRKSINLTVNRDVKTSPKAVKVEARPFTELFKVG